MQHLAAHVTLFLAGPTLLSKTAQFCLIKRKISPEGVALIRLLDCLDNSLVYPKADGDREQGQGNVGCDADDAEHR